MFRINSGQISQEEYSKHMNRMLMQQQQDRNRLEKGTTETIYKFTPMTGGNSMTATNNFHKMQQDACYKGYVNDANGRKIQNCEIFTGPLMRAGSHYANNAQAKTYIDTLLRARAKEIKASTEQEKLKPVNDRTNYKNEQLVEELDTMYEKVSDQVETYNINSFVFDELYKIIKKLQREAYLLRDNDISKYIEQSETIYEFVYDDKAIAKTGNKSLLDSVLLAITRIKKFLKAIKAYSHLPVDQRRGAIKSLSKLLNISSFDKKAILQRRQDRGDDEDDAPVDEGNDDDDDAPPPPAAGEAKEEEDDGTLLYGKTIPEMKRYLYDMENSDRGYINSQIDEIIRERDDYDNFPEANKLYLDILMIVQRDMQAEVTASRKKQLFSSNPSTPAQPTTMEERRSILQAQMERARLLHEQARAVLEKSTKSRSVTKRVGKDGSVHIAPADDASDAGDIDDDENMEELLDGAPERNAADTMVVNKKTIRAAYYTKPNGRNVKIPYYSQDFMENYKTINALKAFREKIGKGPSTSTNARTVQKQILKFLYE